jgi:hypothetical protein
METRMVKKVTYQGEEYFVHITKYVDGKTAIILHPDENAGYSSPDMIVMSVNLSATVDLEESLVAIQDHDFYRGNMDFLVQEGIVEFTGRFEQSGFVRYPICKVLL